MVLKVVASEPTLVTIHLGRNPNCAAVPIVIAVALETAAITTSDTPEA